MLMLMLMYCNVTLYLKYKLYFLFGTAHLIEEISSDSYNRRDILLESLVPTTTVRMRIKDLTFAYARGIVH